MLAIVTTVHILASIIMILVVLLQSGKSADLAGAFGGGGSQTAFGPRGAATLLSKITTASAIIFMITSVTLAIMASRRTTGSVLEGGSTPVPQQTLPASPPASPTPVTPQPQSATPSGQTSGATPTSPGNQGKAGAAQPSKSTPQKPAPAAPTKK
ncbi:MAG: preprotein translocase subunit SecG [Acidobacteriia bacterium]|nr:preprotein translocase subunit SecG [Terriglobia bacterium]